MCIKILDKCTTPNLAKLVNTRVWADSVTEIGSNIFQDCKGLTSVKLSNQIKSIPHQIFCNCTNLTDIIISESVENINFRAFESCINFKIINLPNNLTLISENVFNKCKKLNQIIIENDNILQNIKIEENAFSECNTDKIKIEIENNIDNITKNTKEIDRDISDEIEI